MMDKPKKLKEIDCKFKGCFSECCFDNIKKCPVKMYDEQIKAEAKKWDDYFNNAPTPQLMKEGKVVSDFIRHFFGII